jgi:hypothetical protein
MLVVPRAQFKEFSSWSENSDLMSEKKVRIFKHSEVAARDRKE